MTQAQYAQEQPSENPLTRQIGPLKTWQWALVVVGAYFVYKYVLGGGGSSSSNASGTAFVPASDGSANSIPGPTSTSTVSKVAQTLLYYTATFTKRTAIRDKTGKVIGYITAGKKLILGKRIKINGKWMYPILNMPGKYIAAGNTYTLSAIYADTTTTTTTTTAPALDQTVQAASSVIGTTATGIKSLGTVQIGAPAQTTVPHFEPLHPDFATSGGTPVTVDATHVGSTGIASPTTSR